MKVRILTVLIVGALISACTSLDIAKPKEVQYQHEAGHFSMSVVSVGKWEDYVKELAPKFELTTEGALNKAIPVTANISELSVSKSGVDIKYGFAGNTKTSESKTETNDGITTESSTETTTQSKPEVPSGEAALNETRSKPSSASNTNLAASDSLLAYTAANALYQEVKLLNKHIQDAALRHGYTPYVVRINIGARPYARNLPYDLFGTLSFFPTWVPCNAGKCGEYVLQEIAPGGNSIKRVKYFSDPAIVLPLLVTDSLEAASTSRSEEISRQFNLALGAISSGGIGEFLFGSDKSRISSTAANDLNSTFTVGRMAEGVLEFRMGAVNSSISNVMVTRNHSVTVLIMLPNDEIGARTNYNHTGLVNGLTEIDVRALTSLKHIELGKKSPVQQGRIERRKQLTNLLVQHCADIDIKHKDFNLFLDKTINSILKNDYLEFYQRINGNDYVANVANLTKAIECTEHEDTISGRHLWLKFADNLRSNEFISARFELPIEGTMVLPNPRQTYLVQDSGNAWKLLLTGGKSLVASQLIANATLNLPGNTSLIVPAKSAPSIGHDSSSASFTFPSPKSLGLPSQDWTAANSFSVTISSKSPKFGKAAQCSPAPAATSSCTTGYPNLLLVPVSKKAQKLFDVKVEGGSITEKDGVGILGLTVTAEKSALGKLPVDSITIGVAGGLINSATAFNPDGTAAKAPVIYKASVKTLPNTRVVLNLANLSPAVGLTLSPAGMKGKQTIGKLPDEKVSVIAAKKKK